MTRVVDALDRCIQASTAFFDPATQTPIGDGYSVTTVAYAPNGQLVSRTDDLGRMTRLASRLRHQPATANGAERQATSP